MAEASEIAGLHAAVYNDVDAALADLGAFEQSHKTEMIGKYDAAVVDKEDGAPTSSSAWTARAEIGYLAATQLHDAARVPVSGRRGSWSASRPRAGVRKGGHQSRQYRQASAATDELASELTEAVKK
jgi:hypothetical protein